MTHAREAITVIALAFCALSGGCRQLAEPSPVDADIQRLQVQVMTLSNTVDRLHESIRILAAHLAGIEQFNRMVDEVRYEPVVQETLKAASEERLSNSEPQATGATKTP